ncbi:hypothetical protein Taro_004448 [Colocasia esculenta]|uniref:RNA helicase n=1 Tax=Colocasia esculenta TaxID=4460 RepID=A0A843TK37_COLES|nr:hypothetical protein [Colocasia esculenta]
MSPPEQKPVTEQDCADRPGSHFSGDDTNMIVLTEKRKQKMKVAGKVGSTREKRILAVEFSKAGLEVPEDIKPFKKKGKQSTNRNDVVAVELYPYQSPLEQSILHDGLQQSKKKAEGLSCVEFLGNDIRTTFRSIHHREPDAIMPVPDVSSYETSTCTVEARRHLPLISCDNGREETNSQGLEGNKGTANHPNTAWYPDFTVGKSVVGPTIVHVSRPSDVEEKRRDLPIVMMEQEIMEAINENCTLIICGETGCGKTTQVPQFLYEAGYGSKLCSNKKGMIGVTQPRRVAVLATAKRVSFELGIHLGKEVGFQSDFLLKQYSIIILDEAHERSLNTDILIGMLSRVVQLRQKVYLEQKEKIRLGVKINSDSFIMPLKLILMSATLRVEDFVSDRRLFHEPPPVIEVPTRQFPVTIHFSKRTDVVDYVGRAYKKVLLIHKRLPPGGILVFVTGQREVEYLCKKLQKASERFRESSKREKGNTDIAAIPEVDMKEINEALEVGGDPLQNGEFLSHQEEGDGPYDSDSETGDEVDDDDDDDDDDSVTMEKTSSVLDFLSEPKSLASLKSHFEAIAGGPNKNSEEANVVPSTKEGCSEKSPDLYGAFCVLPLYAMLPASKQLCVFEDVPEGERLVVVATNVAETSLTIPGIKYVVDTGREKVKDYDCNSGMATYNVKWISKASAAQRAGRAGRTGPGHCYRLYSSAVYSNMFSDFSSAEIEKIPVDGVVLLMKSMGIDKVANFPFPTPPDAIALVEAERTLKALGALDGDGCLTHIGRAMAQYPMSPHHSRMLLQFLQIMKNRPAYVRANFVFGYAVAAVAALSFQSPFITLFEGNNENANDSGQEKERDTKIIIGREEKKRQKQLKNMARDAYTRFCNPSSDALTISYALQMFELAENKVEFCKLNLLHFKTMDEMSKLRKQILQLIFFQSGSGGEFSWEHGSSGDVETAWRTSSSKHPLLMVEEELLGQAICAGWANRVAKRVRSVSQLSDEDRKIRAAKYESSALNETIFLHRSSSVARTAPEFVVYTELLCSKRPYMHGVTGVKPDWLVKCPSPLCTFSAPLADPKPYYEPLTDKVLCYVEPIFGQRNWKLPLHSVPIKDYKDRVSVFGCALLQGNVLPCLRSVQRFLVSPPSSILRPEASGQRRVCDLLNKLMYGNMIIDNRAILHEVWRENPPLLYSEIRNWFQQKFHDHFEELWVQMQHEASLDAQELFPKRARKEKKRNKLE